MKFTFKEYKTLKTKKYLKDNKLFFFFNGINQNSRNWIKTEQGLKNINFNYYKIFNKTSTKIFENSIFQNSKPIISGITFFIKPSENNSLVSKKNLLNLDMFIFLGLKMNNKIYSPNQIKQIYSLNYYDSKLLLYQFTLTTIKSNFLIK